MSSFDDEIDAALADIDDETGDGFDAEIDAALGDERAADSTGGGREYPAPDPAREPGIMETFASHFGHGAAFGGSDEAFGLGYAAGGDEIPRTAGRGMAAPLSGAHSADVGTAHKRRELAVQQAANPYTAGIAQALGAGAVSAPMSIAAAPTTTAALAAEGAILAGVYGAGESTGGTVADRAMDAVPAAAVGAMANPMVPVVAQKAAQFSPRETLAAITKWRGGHAADRAAAELGDLAPTARLMSDPLSPEGANLRALARAGEDESVISRHAQTVADELTEGQRGYEAVRHHASIAEKPQPIRRAIERGGVYPSAPNELHPPASYYTDPDALASYATQDAGEDLMSLPPAAAEVPTGRAAGGAGRYVDQKRADAARLAWERRREADEMVAYEFDGDPVALEVWNRVKHKIKGGDKITRLEQFQHYLHDNPAEVAAAQRRLQDVSGIGDESLDDYMSRRSADDVYADELEAYERGLRPAERNPAPEREAAESLGELADDGRRWANEIDERPPTDPRYGEILESLDSIHESQAAVGGPQLNREWSAEADAVIVRALGAADFLAPQGGPPLPVPGAATNAKRIRDAVAIYEPQIRQGIAEGGPDGGAAVFIGLDRLKRAIGRGLNSKQSDIQYATREVYEPLRELLERDDLWGTPAAEIQRESNRAYTRLITADKAGFESRFLSPSPVERTPDNLDNLMVADTAKITEFVKGAADPASQTKRDLMQAGVSGRADLAHTLARYYEAPPHVQDAAARVHSADSRISSVIDQRMREGAAAADLQEIGRRAAAAGPRVMERLPKVGGFLRDLRGDPAHRAQRLSRLEAAAGSSKAAEKELAARRKAAGFAQRIQQPLERTPNELSVEVPGAHRGLAVTQSARTGAAMAPSPAPMSITPEAVLAQIEQDPDAFGEMTPVIQAAAERGDQEAITMAMYAMQR